jgi:carbonic anhydrase
MRVVVVAVVAMAVVLIAVLMHIDCGGGGLRWNGHHGGRGQKENCQEFRFHDVSSGLQD